MTTISVLLPVYNAVKTLPECLDSLFKQTFPEFEIIAIDDGSKDGSYELLTDIAKTESRLKVHRNSQNLGVTKTLNFAASLAQGRYLARMDADDESLPRRFELQKKILDENPQIALVSGLYYFMGKTRKYDQLNPLPVSSEEIRKVITVSNPICHPAVMVRKSVFVEMNGYREGFKNAEDYDLWLRISKKYDLYNIPEPVLRYRLSLGGVTLNKRWEMHIDHHLAIQSFFHPEADLLSLKKKVEQERTQEDKALFLRTILFDLAKVLRKSGHPWEACCLYLKVLREIGIRKFLTNDPQKAEIFLRG